jgi:hypothetical protein
MAGLGVFFIGIAVALLLRAAYPHRRPTGVNAYWRRSKPFTDVPQERLGLISGATYFWFGAVMLLWGATAFLRTTTSFLPDHTVSFLSAALIAIFFWRRWADRNNSIRGG